MATWTPAALSSRGTRLSGTCWRIVEAQHVVSTMSLVDTLAEQHLLEQLLDTSKPPLPPECRHLHYLLSTPFRYAAPYPHGSRFRRAGFTPGVFYASDSPAVAVAEMAFRRLSFYADSPETPWPANASEYTVFAVRFKTMKAIDLTIPPLARDARKWTSPSDYTHCQALADSAREAGIQVVRYQSARSEGRNIALLTCSVFVDNEPRDRQTWRLHIGPSGARAICNHPEQRLAFDASTLSRGPAALRLKR